MGKMIVFSCLFLLFAGFVSGSIDADFSCVVDGCVEGSLVNWSVSVLNNINRSVVVGDVFVVDVGTYQLIALHNSEDVLLKPGGLHVFRFQNLVPAPLNGGYTFQFKPCFNVSAGDDSAVVCRDFVESFNVLPLSKVKCFSDSDCGSAESCLRSAGKCKVLDCSSGEVVVGHKCVLSGCSWFQYRFGSGCIFNPLIITSLVLLVFGFVLVVLGFSFRPKKRKNKKGSKKRS